MLEVGTIVGGKFRIEKLIGRGGMGVVAIATHLQLEQRVAIKVLHAPLADDATARDRFLREARTPMRLRSDHVCKVFDVGTLDSGAPYIVMELLEGADLASIVAYRPLEIPAAVDHVLQAMIALAEAHAQGIVHRDLKPANLFVTRRIDGSPLVKVLDFGIAKSATSTDVRLTGTTAVMGSPGYMSPEQLRSAHHVDARTDVWSLGAILYELVSGRVPFPATSLTELAMKVATDPPQPLPVDPRYQAVVFRCLEKDIARRYQDVGELARDLAPLGGPGAPELAALIARLVAPAGRAATLPVAMAPGAPTAPATMAPVSPGAPTAASTTLGTAAAERGAPPTKRRRAPAIVVVGVLGVTATVTVVTTVVANRPATVQMSTTESRDAIAQGSPGDAATAPTVDAGAVAFTSPRDAVIVDAPAKEAARTAPADAAPAHASGLPPVPGPIVEDIEHKIAANECAAAQRELLGLQGTNDIKPLSLKVGECFANHPASTAAITGEKVKDLLAHSPALRQLDLTAARELMAEHKYGPAYNEASGFVSLHPDDQEAIQIATIAACELGKVKHAQDMFAKLHDDGRRTEVRTRCAHAHITLP